MRVEAECSVLGGHLHCCDPSTFGVLNMDSGTRAAIWRSTGAPSVTMGRNFCDDRSIAVIDGMLKCPSLGLIVCIPQTVFFSRDRCCTKNVAGAQRFGFGCARVANARHLAQSVVLTAVSDQIKVVNILLTVLKFPDPGHAETVRHIHRQDGEYDLRGRSRWGFGRGIALPSRRTHKIVPRALGMSRFRGATPSRCEWCYNHTHLRLLPRLRDWWRGWGARRPIGWVEADTSSACGPGDTPCVSTSAVVDLELVLCVLRVFDRTRLESLPPATGVPRATVRFTQLTCVCSAGFIVLAPSCMLVFIVESCVSCVWALGFDSRFGGCSLILTMSNVSSL